MKFPYRSKEPHETSSVTKYLSMNTINWIYELVVLGHELTSTIYMTPEENLQNKLGSVQSIFLIKISTWLLICTMQTESALNNSLLASTPIIVHTRTKTSQHWSYPFTESIGIIYVCVQVCMYNKLILLINHYLFLQ